MTELLIAAIAYAARGWPVLPLRPGEKVPLGRLVPRGLKDASTNPDVISKWWKAEPTANIGLVTGVEFDVLDVDGDAGWTSLARMVDQFGCLSSSPVSMTPGGGAHYLVAPTGIGNKASFRPKLDWRGAGGYIVAPPSIHPNGGSYWWLVSPDEVDLEPAPRWLVELLIKPRRSEQLVTDHQLVTGTAYGRAALEREVGRVVLAPVGRRNDTLNRAAFALGQLVVARALDVNKTYDTLVQAGIAAGLSEAEAGATVESGMAAGLVAPRSGAVS